MAERFRVMVVDDDEAAREFYLGALEECFEVVTASDGFEALRKLVESEPDLMILDVAMPVMDGFEFCLAVRKKPEFQGTEVIFLSARDDPETIKRAYAVGGNLFVKKPVEAARLIKNINLSLGRLDRPRKKRFTLGTLTSDALRVREGDEAREALAQAPAAQPEEPEPELEEEEEDLAPARVMIVDDDPELRTFLELALEEDYEVVLAPDGLEALERLRDYEPDVLLLDIMMPKMNGYQLCQALRRNPAYGTSPIVFLTAKHRRKDREYANRCGADAFVSKPFDVAKLKELIDSLIEKPQFAVRPKTYTMREIKMREREEELERQDIRQVHKRQEEYARLKDFIDHNK
jgi:CheY-like chemotaxis protein